jgi:hypothetical protein
VARLTAEATRDGKTYIPHRREQTMHATITAHNSRRYVKRIINGLAVSTLLLAGAALAEVFDAKVYPGTMCHQRGVLPRDSTVRYENKGTIVNVGLEPVSIICPMVRDHPDLKPRYATIVVYDAHNEVDPTCSVRVIRPDGTVSASMPPDNDPNREMPPVGVKVFLFREFTNAPAEHDAYFARCDNIPGNFLGEMSGIFTYSLTEYN